MPVQSNAFQHLSIRKRLSKTYEKFPHPTQFGRVVDKIVYISTIGLPLLNFIQLYRIWAEKSILGLSLISWFGFAFFSLIWMIYGIIHKEKPIILLNAGLFIVQSLIAISIIYF